jgi:hypothetical protein
MYLVSLHWEPNLSKQRAGTGMAEVLVRAFFVKSLLVPLALLALAACERQPAETRPPGPIPLLANDRFRDGLVQHVRAAVAAPSVPMAAPPEGFPREFAAKGDWWVELTLYHRGEKIGTWGAGQRRLGKAVDKAVGKMQAAAKDDQRIPVGRLLIRISDADGGLAEIVEYQGRGLELVHKVVAVRSLTAADVRAKILAGRDYLLRSQDPQTHGFHKRYDAITRDRTTQVRTIYTASSLYTLLKSTAVDDDPRVAAQVLPIAGFLLAMQSADEETRGAFHYSLDTATGRKDGVFKVGTASKTIYTLLVLHRRTGDAAYLAAAERAGEWLLSMRKDSGWMKSSVSDDGQDGLVHDDRQSYLYTGQALSAFSRMHGATGDRRHLDAAATIAALFMAKAAELGDAASDDYRTRSIVSVSWIAMSLLDYYKVSGDEQAWCVLTATCDALVKRQYTDPADLLNCGRFSGSLTTSGNGWINEVLGEVHRLALERQKDPERAEVYKTAIVRSMRWLVQNTYSAENTYAIPDPEMAFGGLIRNRGDEAVRTDAVCHGVNGYINILDGLDPEGELLPEGRTTSRF